MIDGQLLGAGLGRAADHQRRRIGPGLAHIVADIVAAHAGFLEDFAAHRVFDGFRRFYKAGQARPHPGRKMLLPAEQAFVAARHQHDHHRVGAREMLGLAVWAIAAPAALRHGGAGAAIGAVAVALIPADQRFGGGDRRQLLRRDHALHHQAAQIGQQRIGTAGELFGRGRRHAHAEQRRAVVAQPEKHRAGIGAERDRFIDGELGARAARLLLQHQTIAMHHIGAGAWL